MIYRAPLIYRTLFSFETNVIRGVSVHFGEKALAECLKKINIRCIIRAHQVNRDACVNSRVAVFIR